MARIAHPRSTAAAAAPAAAATGPATCPATSPMPGPTTGLVTESGQGGEAHGGYGARGAGSGRGMHCGVRRVHDAAAPAGRLALAATAYVAFRPVEA